VEVTVLEVTQVLRLHLVVQVVARVEKLKLLPMVLLDKVMLVVHLIQERVVVGLMLQVVVAKEQLVVPTMVVQAQVGMASRMLAVAVVVKVVIHHQIMAALVAQAAAALEVG
jgi:hypothetical protein